MSKKQLADILAMLDKLKIDLNPNLDKSEKELYKLFIDELKKYVK